MKIILQLLILPFILLSFIVSAQVKTNFNNPASITEKGRFAKPYKIQVDFEVAAKDIAVLLKLEKDEVAKSKETKAFQLAVPVSVDLDIAKLINWNYDSDFSYGKFTIKLNGALSSSINFDQFYLPNGTEMYIYNENGGMITGAITDNENNSNKIWGSWVYKGQFITLEIKTPLLSVKQLLLHSNNIAYGYKEVYKTKVADFGTSGPCEINVLCPLGNGWEAERNSVALILSDNGGSWCSGAMIMNTCSTNRPFFLTANHCLTGQNVAAWRFTFQAWSPTCNPSQNANGVTYNGSTLRANWGNSDFCLVELNNTPPVNSGINYAGWTISNVPAQNATGIHHPHGDVMKISRANNAVARIGYRGVAGNDHWQANWSPQNNGAGQVVTAVTEGGSSGSPLFDQNHRITGQLHGGPSVCGGAQLWDYYGSFDVSWTGGGTNATRLSNWLDPTGTNALTTNTTNISLLLPPTLQVSVSQSDCNNATAYANLPSGSTFHWSVSGDLLIDGTSSTKITTDNFVNFTGTQGSPYVTITTNCGTLQGGVTYAPYLRQIQGLFEVYSNGDQVVVSVNTTAYDTYYKWYINGVLDYEGVSASEYCTCYSGVGRNIVCGDNTMRVEVTACGAVSSSDEQHFNKMGNCSFSSVSNVELFPNPAKVNVTVRLKEINNQKGSSQLQDIREIKVFDKLGNFKKIIKYPTNTKTITLNMSDLNTDIYDIEVSDGKNKASLQLSIQK